MTLRQRRQYENHLRLSNWRSRHRQSVEERAKLIENGTFEKDVPREPLLDETLQRRQRNHGNRHSRLGVIARALSRRRSESLESESVDDEEVGGWIRSLSWSGRRRGSDGEFDSVHGAEDVEILFLHRRSNGLQDGSPRAFVVREEDFSSESRGGEVG